MKALAGALVTICGAAILFYVFTTPGDQTALAVLGGAVVGLGFFSVMDS